MQYKSPLISGTLIKRYKRFFADVRLADGTTVIAHCPNTGSMKSCGQMDDTVYLTQNNDPKRKLKFTWELTKAAAGLICVNTMLPNKIVEEAVLQNQFEELEPFTKLRREVKYGTNSKIDILLEHADHKTYIEVKNVTLYDDGFFQFPDAVTTRGLKHLNELVEVKKQGHRAIMFYLINRSEQAKFKPAKAIDPAYYQGLLNARENGVEILAYQANIDLEQITIGDKISLAVD